MENRKKVSLIEIGEMQEKESNHTNDNILEVKDKIFKHSNKNKIE